MTKEEMTKEADELKEQKKKKWLLRFGFSILIVAVIVLAICVVYSQKLNISLAAETAKLQGEYKKLQDFAAEEPKPEPTAEEPTAAPTETPQPDSTEAETDTPVETNEDAVQRNMDQQLPDENKDDKVINSPENASEYVTYEHYIEGKKFSFQYPSSWDGKVIFANITQDDGTVVVTCYQSAQYGDHQNGAPDTGEIFHILVNKDPAYQAEGNAQYKMSEKDGYCGYYIEPSGVTYDYVNHGEYAEDYKLVYDTQGKVWRSFIFN